MQAVRASGDENVPGIAALGKAVDLLERVGMDVIRDEERRLTRKAERPCRDRKRATPYDQILPSEMGLALTFPVPTVEVVSLDRYEALLGGGS